jgi:hypothetical protein
MKGYQRSNPSPPSMSGWLTSHLADEGGAQARRGGTIWGSLGFGGQNDAGVDRVPTWGKTRRGTAPIQLVAVASLLRA